MEVKVNSLSYLVEQKPAFAENASSWTHKKNNMDAQNSLLLLDKVTLTLNPGSVSVLLGLGNEHKNLLDCIAMRQKDGLIGGKIYYDAVVRKTGLYRDIALVNDAGITHFSGLTVFDYLYFGARLRTTQNEVECRERARHACRVTGLDGTLKLHTLHTTELRIVSIAIELVGNPTLIVLTDITEGLDAYATLEVMKVLRSVAKRTFLPTTIVYNVSSVNDDMYRLVDTVHIFVGNTLHYTHSSSAENTQRAAQLITEASLVLLEANRAYTCAGVNNNQVTADLSAMHAAEVAHNGVQQRCGEHIVALIKIFEALDLLPTASTTPNSDININSNSSCSSGKQRQASSQYALQPHDQGAIEHGRFKGGILPRLSSTGVHNMRSSEVYSLSRRLDSSNDTYTLLRQPKPQHIELYILLCRTMQHHWRNVYELMLGVLRFTTAAVFLGCIALHQGNHLQSINLVTSPSTGLIDMHAYNTSAVLYAVVLLSVVSAAFAVPYIHSVVHTLKQEIGAGIATTSAAYISLVLVDICMYILGCILVSAIVRSMVGIQGNASAYYWLLVLTTMCSYSLAACCSVWLQSLRAAWSLFAFVSAVCLIFTGFLQRLGSLGGLWKVLSSIVFTRWAFEGLSILAFSDAPDRDSYLTLFGFTNTTPELCSVWLLLWVLMLQTCVLVGLLPHMYKVKHTSNGKIDAIRRDEGTNNSVSTSANVVQTSHTHSSILDEVAYTLGLSSTNPLITDASVHSVSTVPAQASESYEPPHAHTEDSGAVHDDNVTIHFENVNTLFGEYMHIHTHDADTSDTHTSDTAVYGKPPVRPVGAQAAIQNSSAYSNSIRNRAALNANSAVAGTNNVVAKAEVSVPSSSTGIHTFAKYNSLSGLSKPKEVYSTPTKVPLLSTIALTPGSPTTPYTPNSIPVAPVPLPKYRDTHASYERIESQQLNPEGALFTPRLINIPKHHSTTLSFSRVKYVQQGYEHAEPKLQNISYKLNPGTCCCIVDGNGENTAATLLHVLAGKTQSLSLGKTTGVICANDQRLGKDMRYLNAAYVQKGDVPHCDALTVREVLRYSAYLKRTDHAVVSSVDLIRYHLTRNSQISSEVPYDAAHTHTHASNIHGHPIHGQEDWVGKSFDIEQRISEVISMMGLEPVADTLVGKRWTLQEEEQTTATSLLSMSRAPIKLLNMANLRSRRNPAGGGGQPVPTSASAAARTSSGPNAVNTGGGISAAELRCLTIGVELVNRPGLVFLEDPFADLQWQDSEKVAAVLRCLANGGRTVLCTIDKPCQRIVQYMNDLMLLGGGLLVYSGPTETVGTYFANIGFERLPGQSDLDFVLDIAADRGKMSLVGGKRGNTLSAEDLADLNRSLVNIKAGRQKGEDAFSQDAAEQEDTLISAAAASTASNIAGSGNVVYHPAGRSITRAQEPPLGSTAVVLIARGAQVLAGDRLLVLRHCGQCFLAGLLLGSVWWGTNAHNYQSRISLFATAFLYVNLFVVDCIEGIFKRKEVFIRETAVQASGYGAYFLSDCIPTYILYTVGCFLFSLPLYCMAGLRPGLGPFLYFNIMTLLSVYCNLCLAYLLSMHVHSQLVCQMVFAGVILPLQLLMSGYLVLIRTMPLWVNWGSALCPMYFYMAGVFRNEFYSNSYALGEGVSYRTLSVQYDYYSDQPTCMFVLIVLGLSYKCLWLLSLRLFSLLQRRAVLQQVYGARRKARKLIKAGLRWRNHYAAPGSGGLNGIQMSEHNGIGIEDDGTGEIDFGNQFHIP